MKSKKLALSLIFLVFAVLIVFFIITRGKPKIVVEDARLIQSTAMKNAASAFMLIKNDGAGSDTLTGCSMKEFPSARGELHDIVGGKMTKVEEIGIPAKEITLLKRGSLHMMFFELPEKLEDEVTLILNFEKSGSIEMRANIHIVK